MASPLQLFYARSFKLAVGQLARPAKGGHVFWALNPHNPVLSGPAHVRCHLLPTQHLQVEEVALCFSTMYKSPSGLVQSNLPFLNDSPEDFATGSTSGFVASS